MHRSVLAILLIGAFGVSGCLGMLGDPDVEVATIELKADDLGALLATECVQKYGQDGCSRYPNPMECESMTISIRGDGKTCSVCVVGGKVQSRTCGAVGDGIPVMCKANADLTCHQCVDVYGNTVLDNCSRGAQLYRARGGGWGLDSTGSGWLEEPSGSQTPPTTPPTTPPKDPPTNPPTDPNPPGDGKPSCDPSQARIMYAKILNQILAQEGLKFTYSPDLTNKYKTKSGYWGFGSTKKDMCKYWLNSTSQLTQCWSKQSGKCHCKAYGGKPTCKCARINVFTLQQACKNIPPTCNHDEWVAGIVMEYGVATNWLFAGTYYKGYYGGLPSKPYAPPDGKAPQCLGSPLVLDLGDDGIAPTSPEDGVVFDLMGHGDLRSAWISGDDALLVMDRNGNGVIDDGTELFGSATDVGGAPAEDGFAALALLDRASRGGNEDGRLDADDLMFSELKVWNDTNHDGASQAGELRGLAQAGVKSVDVGGHSRCGDVVDAHGNDLSLRGSFERSDGRRGLVVDVLFRAGR